MRQLLSDNLDCPVHAFARPDDAIAALPRLDAAVIVTDYYMPQMNGIQFVRAAAPLAPGAAFVLISGHNLAVVEDELEQLSALRGFLAKPFGWRKLASEILRVWPDKFAAPKSRVDVTSP